MIINKGYIQLSIILYYGVILEETADMPVKLYQNKKGQVLFELQQKWCILFLFFKISGYFK